jgi:hypothetical protein
MTARRGVHRAVVVLDDSKPLLLLGERHSVALLRSAEVVGTTPLSLGRPSHEAQTP